MSKLIKEFENFCMNNFPQDFSQTMQTDVEKASIYMAIYENFFTSAQLQITDLSDKTIDNMVAVIVKVIRTKRYLSESA